METIYELEKVNIGSKTVDKVSKAIVEIIKKELPEEAQCYDVISFILDNILNELKSKRIEL